MTASICGLPKAKVNKYGAERYLEITKNYHLILINLQQEEEEVESDVPEWESPYFVDESAGSSNTSRKRGGATKRGFGRKKRGARSQSGSGNSGGFSDKGSKYSAYKFSRGSSKKVPSAGKNQRGGSSSSRGGSSSSRGGLGFMPVPQPKRSFLGGGAGTYF
ncbi:keratin, type I cytoskeletal 9-like [Saccostrea cucullata]|uniref:keratin, type I cytoskeletal 9-like n=1 Tax=Saccostrea cuccullata TaxID=36930 RepID=UPI002ED43DE1